MKSPKNILILVLVLSMSLIQAQSKFELPELNFTYSALEPYIDSQTMMIHHSKHHLAYITNLNKSLENDTNKYTIEDIIRNVSKFSMTVRNNAGGHYNHSFFWSSLTSYTNKKPFKAFNEAIISQFGSLENLKNQINQTALSQFGSGWVWLSMDKDNKLFISSTPNQDNPLMDVVDNKGTPILGIDVWEHAYYLRYQNKRADYLSAIWNVINWHEVSKRYSEVLLNSEKKITIISK
jgi:Fe-Mn family superoxide dismutase